MQRRVYAISPSDDRTWYFGWSDVSFAGGGNHWVGIHLLAGAQNNRIQVRKDDFRFIYLLYCMSTSI